MRWLVTMGLAAALLVSIFGTANAGMRDGWRWRKDRWETFERPRHSFDYREVRLTIRAAVDRWSVPGGTREALAVAGCESGLSPKAENPYSSASGVYQIVHATWVSWRSSISGIARRFRLKRSVFNARANVIVAIVHAHRYGWSAWSCA
jgi:hypothetical protein